jgi:hypothetical protein
VACDTPSTPDDVDIETRGASLEVMHMFDKRMVTIDVPRRSSLRRWLTVAFGATLLALHANSAWAAECTWTGNAPLPY